MITRFAPSPTGLLHLGHAYSALVAFRAAERAKGRFLLRIEDIDHTRSRPAFEEAIYRDLHWLGINWETPVMRQSDRQNAYRDALHFLDERGLLYACTCTRRDIEAALSAPQEGDVQIGPDGPVYPGTCRDKNHPKSGTALRLNIAKAIEYLGDVALKDMSFQEVGQRYEGEHRLGPDDLLNGFGDIVLARKDIGTSYHLAVVLDDAAQGVTHIYRGEDMFSATYIHRLLQALFKLPVPQFHHHQLIRDEDGKRLAKRDDARAIAVYRRSGLSPEDVITKLPSI